MASTLHVSLQNSFGSPDGPYRLQSLGRAVSILELLGESRVPLSLAEISRRIHLHKSTVHRALIVLERSMLLERTPENTFRLGLKLFDLGNRAVEQMELRTRLEPYARRLSARLGETVHVGVLQKTSVVYLDRTGPGNRVCGGSNTGKSNPAYCTSLGKAIMAWLPRDTMMKLIDQITFVRFTEKTICSREELLEALGRVRQRGYSIDDEEIETGVRCIGAPVFDDRGAPVAALSVSCMSSRIRPFQVPVIARTLMRCCTTVSGSLKFHNRINPQAMYKLAQN